MAAKELSVWQGRLTQDSGDADASAEFRIRRGARKAIQIYGFDFNVNAAILTGVAAPFSTIIQLRADNDVSLTGEVIVFEQSVMFTPGAGGGEYSNVGAWRAPPSFVTAKDFLRVVLMSYATGIANEALFTVYYKEKGITDIQDIQLRLIL